MTPPSRTGVTRLVGMLTRRPAAIRRDADDELESVLEERVARLVDRGMPIEDARAEALRRLGGSKELARAALRRSASRRERIMGIHEWFAGLALDLRYAVRGLRREPLFSLFAILTLALGIGANAAMFGIVDKLLLRGPAHVRDAARVVRLFWTDEMSGRPDGLTAAFDPRVYANLVAESRAFSGLAMFTGASRFTLYGQAPAARLVASASATANLMSVLGASPAAGRFFTLEEQQSPASPNVAVLGYDLWQQDFGGDKDIVGRSVTISSRPYTVVGVAPEGFTGVGLERVDLWLLLHTKTGPAARHWSPGHMSGPGIVGRLRPGVSAAQAASDATTAYRTTYDGTDRQYAEASISVGPLHFGRDGTESTEARIARWLAGVSAIVLLIACANIANLLLARAMRRRREMTVRLALGAGRARLLRLLLANSVVLALLGGAAGLAVAAGAGSLVRHVLLPEVDWTSGPVNGRVLLFSLAAALITGIAIGLLPALRAGRTDLARALKAGARERGGHRSTLRAALTVAQAALAMLLLVGAGLFVRSLERVRHLDLGVQPAHVLELSPIWPQLPAQASDSANAREERRREQFAQLALDRLRAAPAVAHAAAAIGMPFGSTMSIPVGIPGRDSLPRVSGGFANPDVSEVSGDYFATIGTRLLRGRLFTAADRAGSEPVAIVSETMARVVWPRREAIGECLLIWGKDAPCTRVVGVVQDARRGRIREDPIMHYYLPLGQQSTLSDPELVVRPRGDPEAALPALRALVRQIDPTVSFVSAHLLQERLEPQTRSWRIGAMMFTLFAVLALVVAAVGMFSVVAYLVEQRRQEIGVRIALGAQSGQVVALMLRGALAVTVLGVALGAVLAILGGRFAEPLLFQTSARDPLVIGGVAVVLTLVSAAASVVPALRVRRMDPMTALREE